MRKWRLCYSIADALLINMYANKWDEFFYLFIFIYLSLISDICGEGTSIYCVNIGIPM